VFVYCQAASQAASQVANQGIEAGTLGSLWALILDVLRLNAEVFREISTRSHSLLAALLIVFVAGFFQSLSQIVVLFINQVRPLRFLLSLLISALFVVVGYGFWALSTWMILSVVFHAPLSFLEMLRTLGFSYAPLAVLGVFVMLPYFGGGVFVVLSIWTLLAVIVGLESLTDMSRWDAFASAALGWVVLQLLQKTVGQPIASLGQWITNWAAGEELITNRMRLAQELYAGLRSPSASVDGLDAMAWQQEQHKRFAENRSVARADDASERQAPRRSLSQAILSQSLQDARERLRAENRDNYQ